MDSSHLRNGGDVVEDVLGVGDTLDVDGLGTVVDGGSERFGSNLGDPLDANTEVLERNLELIVGLT